MTRVRYDHVRGDRPPARHRRPWNSKRDVFDWNREIPEWRPVAMTGALLLSSAAFFLAGMLVESLIN